MARKNKNNTETETETTDIFPDAMEQVVAGMPNVPGEPKPSKMATPKHVPPAQKAPVPPKKRIRIRPSQKKKLSVAVLCTNPLTRRFI